MKILVVDDNQEHLKSARDELGGHELICFDAYEDAIPYLREGTDVDILLSDLLMPAEAMTLGREGMKHLGKEIPIGLVLAIRAAMSGVKRVAVATDINHHDHPMSAALDLLRSWSNDWKRDLITINSSRVLIIHAPLRPDKRKAWGQILEVLLA